MTKEVEVGDEYIGKVVKTTTFGAFVELAKGTDGLLHISNVSPGQRVDTVEDVLNKGDEVNVRVVEVDRERGRIGLRLADDPDIAGKSVEELAGVGSGGGGGGSAGRPRTARGRDGGGRERPLQRPLGRAAPTAAARRERRARLGAAATTVAIATDAPSRAGEQRASDNHARLGRASGHRARAQRALGGARLLDRHGLGAASTRSRPASRTCSSTCCSAAPTATARTRSTRSSTRWAPRSTLGTDKEATSLYTRVLDRHLERAFDVMGEMVWHPRFGDLDAEREVVLEEIAMYEDDPQEQVFDVLGEADLRRASARARRDRPRGGRRAVTREQLAAFHARALPAARHRDRRRRIDRPRRARGDGPRRRAHPRDKIELAPANANGDSAHASQSGGPAGGARRLPPARAVPAERHRAVPRVPRRRGDRAQRRAPLRAARARRRARRHILLAAVPGGARAARPGLLGVHRSRTSTRTPGEVGLYVGTRPDNVGEALAVDRRRARALRRGMAASRSRTRSWRARARTSRGGSCSRWSRPARA